MDLSNNVSFLEQLIRHEGSVREDGMHIAYRCPAGALTIGYGHNLDARPVDGLGEGSRISEHKARELLAADILDFQKSVFSTFPWLSSVDEARCGVVVNMAFNMGLGTLKKFTSMLKAMQNGDWQNAAHYCIYRSDRVSLHPWVKQVKGRAWELAEQLRTGTWQKGYESWMNF